MKNDLDSEALVPTQGDQDVSLTSPEVNSAPEQQVNQTAAGNNSESQQPNVAGISLDTKADCAQKTRANTKTKKAVSAKNQEWRSYLLPQHEELIDKSAIDPDVAEERGYISAQTKVVLKNLGFSSGQWLVPALLIPVWGVNGERCTYQIRPDTPRIKDGKPLKYETPSRSRMYLDVPPRVRKWLGDPKKPLFITEGVRKADSAASRDLCCIALLGVWNFRGSNEYGGKAALADWEFIALNDREVYIVFDSDVMLKEEVHLAMSRLSGFLEKRDAKVRFIYLPPGDGGIKTGLDDYFAGGHGVEDLLAHASANLKDLPSSHTQNRVPYVATPDGMVWMKSGPNQNTEVPLTNFSAKIIGEQIQDDGQNEHRLVEVEVTLKGEVTRVKVPNSEFASLKWVTAHLGQAAIIYPGFGNMDHTRTAIQQLSGEYPTSRVYSHLGWRKIEGKWFYLHAGGTIGPEDGPENQSGWPNEAKPQDQQMKSDRANSSKIGTIGPLLIEEREENV